MRIKASYSNTPSWRSAYTQVNLPKELLPLEKVARNLWWVWNNDATDLFAEFDPELWKKSEHNPVILLQKISYERIDEILKDSILMDKVKKVIKNFESYIAEKFDKAKPSVAYFSMEYGFSHVLKIYPGGPDSCQDICQGDLHRNSRALPEREYALCTDLKHVQLPMPD